MRWAQVLQTPSLVIDSQVFDRARLAKGEYTLLLGPDEEGRKAYIGICMCDGQVTVSVLAEGLEKYGARPDHEEWYNRAYLAVSLNPKHDHATRWSYAVDDRNEIVHEAHFACPGEELGDDAARVLDTPAMPQAEFEYLDDSRFFARLSFADEGLWNEVGLAGLALRVGFHEIPMPDSLAWPNRVTWAKDSPLTFGDLYKNASSLYVDSMDLGKPVWGGDPSPIFLNCQFVSDSTRAGTVKVRIDLPTDGVYEQGPFKWDCDGANGQIEIPLIFPFRAKWSNGLENVARLHVNVLDEQGDLIWNGAFPFGFDTGILVRERFGGIRVDRPEPTDANFLNAFRSFILSHLPNYLAKTTREGAPSDFYLEDPEGGASVDLATADALDQVATMIAERFPNWQDALCAAAMWVHHPCVTRHSSTWSRVSNSASIETIPRLAGCFCGDTTRLTALLAEKIGEQMKVPLRGLSMGLRGHLATWVESPIGVVVIDGMLGLWFHTLDNRQLATLDEMRTQREIAERVWYAPRAHGHEYFFGVNNQLIRPFKSGPLVWPAANDGR
jgi:hypothetical protein